MSDVKLLSLINEAKKATQTIVTMNALVAALPDGNVKMKAVNVHPVHYFRLGMLKILTDQ